jgi:hypothetical protein
VKEYDDALRKPFPLQAPEGTSRINLQACSGEQLPKLLKKQVNCLAPPTRNAPCDRVDDGRNASERWMDTIKKKNFARKVITPTLSEIESA